MFEKLKQDEYNLNASKARDISRLAQYNLIFKKITEEAEYGNKKAVIYKFRKCILPEVVEKLENDGFNIEITSDCFTISWENVKNCGRKAFKIRELSILSQYNLTIERINDDAKAGEVSTEIFDMYPEVVEKLKNKGFDIVIPTTSMIGKVSWKNIS